MRDNIYYYSQLTHLVGNKLALLGTELELIRKLILYVSVKQNNQHKKQNKQKQKSIPGAVFLFPIIFFQLIITWLSNLQTLSVLDEGYSRNVSAHQSLKSNITPVWNTAVPLLNYSCKFQVEICSQQLEICKSVCMFTVLAIVVEID